MNSVEFAIEWIAMNDNPTQMDAEKLTGTISVCLAADIYNRPVIEIAERVVEFRKNEQNRKDKSA